ncbi:MAG: preprotein translocase subunit YajC [Gemmatimonadota bacterium]
MIPSILAVVASPEGGQTSLMPMIIMWTAIIAIFYFLLIRPQKKAQQKHQEMVAGLQKGDEIVTDGGIVGQVIHLREDRLTIKTAGDTRIEVARGKVARVVGKGS